MAYTAGITRDNPTCLIFVLDQSTSMSMKIEGGQSKAAFLADVVNKTLYTLITSCTKADGIRDYFYVAVIVYSGTTARNGFAGQLAGNLLHPVSRIANNPLRIEERRKKTLTDSSEVTEQRVKFPVWFDPVSSGKTSMCAGLSTAAELARDWCCSHMNGYPPTVLHVTDGHPTDGDPEVPAADIRATSTEDGQALLFNLHIDIGAMNPILFPNDDRQLSDKYGKRLFRMSSCLPQHLNESVKRSGYSLLPGARGFIFNGGAECIVDFFDIGTRARTAADR